MRDQSRCALLERECAGARNAYCVCNHRSLRGATSSRRALYLQEVCIAPPLLVVIHPLSHTDAKHPRPLLPERVVNSSLSAVLNDKVHMRTQLQADSIGTNVPGRYQDAVAPISRSSECRVSRGAHMPRCAPHQPVLPLPYCSTCSRVTLCEGDLSQSDVFTPVALIKGLLSSSVFTRLL